MRRLAILLAALVFVPAAHASSPAVTAQASPSTGAAPLAVTLTASGDLATYHWDLGDGTTADGAIVQHVYPAGRFVARVTATTGSGAIGEEVGAIEDGAIEEKGTAIGAITAALTAALEAAAAAGRGPSWGGTTTAAGTGPPRPFASRSP